MQTEKYLRLLAKEYPNVRAARGEIVRLKTYLELPKGTEYFFSDLHGEDGAFIHLMRSGSGNIRTKVRDMYKNTLTEREQNQLANLIYDPEKVLGIIEEKGLLDDEWIRFTILRLSELLRYVSAKQSRETVRNTMPEIYADVLNELLYSYHSEFDRMEYSHRIVRAIIEADAEREYITVLCEMIQRLSVNFVHIIGDIFDRGKAPHNIMEELIDFGKIDIQWGNHDIMWMGAAAGNEVCMCSVLRANIAYNNFDALEDGYGLNLRALSSFAQDVYGDDPCERFIPKVIEENVYDMVDIHLAAKMHKAIAVLMFKLEMKLYDRNPEFDMDDRKTLYRTDFKRMVFTDGEKEYPLLDTNFPTIDPDDPAKLTKEEEELLHVLRSSFLHSEPLHRHVAFLYTHGSSYQVTNNNLLFHGCIPMTEDGAFDTMDIGGKKRSGKELMDYISLLTGRAYYGEGSRKEKQKAVDFMWYLWCGPKSPMFGKSKIATFENYFVKDAAVRKEVYNPYFKLSEHEEVVDRIIEEFGITGPHAHIINGHVPVKIKEGEKPVKANGKLFVIDGGISKAYQPKTGIAGYTLIFNSHHLALAEHSNFDQIENDIGSYTPNLTIEDKMERRLLIADTDQGLKMKERVEDLELLIRAYREGTIKEKL